MHGLFVVLLVALLAGCGGIPPLADAQPGPSEVARAVVDALERQDRESLLRLALNADEFRDHVWPGLPAARPERNLTVGYVWSDLRPKSEAGLSHYPGYRVHRQASVRVKHPDGSETEERLFGSMLEKDGRWKVFSYVVD
jgi:uncharacterized protein YceK